MLSCVARRIVDIFVVLVISLAAWATPALSRAPATQATDPNANSPAGVVYSIPLDSARQDAAPHGHSGQSGAGGGSTGSGGGGSGSGGGGSGSGTGGGSTAAARGRKRLGRQRLRRQRLRRQQRLRADRAPAARGSGQNGAGGSATGGRGAATVLVPGGQPGSLIHSANGFGSSSQVPGLNAPSGSGLGALQGNAGSAPLLAIILTLVVMLIGGYAGVRSWKVPRQP